MLGHSWPHALHIAEQDGERQKLRGGESEAGSEGAHSKVADEEPAAEDVENIRAPGRVDAGLGQRLGPQVGADRAGDVHRPEGDHRAADILACARRDAGILPDGDQHVLGEEEHQRGGDADQRAHHHGSLEIDPAPFVHACPICLRDQRVQAGREPHAEGKAHDVVQHGAYANAAKSLAIVQLRHENDSRETHQHQGELG
mmetsp:Transcript_42568/g.123740  ORF Transcript_42568/g.123740 Transcript_42568/m.123740 type:complete len:200 (+) Transcript_42568:892-1491(+)